MQMMDDIKGESLVIMRFLVPDVVGCVDCEVCCVDVVSFQGGLKELGVVDCTTLVEMQLLVLH